MKKVIWILVALIVIFSSTYVIWREIEKRKDNESSQDDIVLRVSSDVGVWWWHKADADKYLRFAKQNGIDEIYYCDYDMNEQTSEFVLKAKEKGIKVYALWGEYQWIFNQTGFDELMTKYKNYQQTHQNAMFEGVHLDVEPHQVKDDEQTSDVNESFSENRHEYLTKYVEFVYYATNTYQSVMFDFDIPFWIDDAITFKGETKECFKHVIDMAGRVFVMSYRDTAEKIVDVANEELEYAKTKNKKIALSVEMTSSEGDQVSFEEESKKQLCKELEEVECLIDQEILFSVHHIETWFGLKEE